MHKLILISGSAAAGKTSLANVLSEKLNLPYFSKDQIKESLFDSLGWSDKEWSQKLGMAAIKLLYVIAESEMSAGRVFIIESNFKDKIDTVQIEQLSRKYGYQVLEFHCFARMEMLIARFKERVVTNRRHPGHVDHLFSESYFDPTVFKPMTLGAIKVDTSDFAKLDYSELVNKARIFLEI